MLEVANLTVAYRETLVLDGVGFWAAPGQAIGIVGPNGAGKSTLMKALLGLVPVLSGSIRFCGRQLQHVLPAVAYFPQRSQIDWDYPATVWDVAMLARCGGKHGRLFGWPSRRDRHIVAAALDRVGLLELRHRPIGQLSGGQQQRVFLARVLAQEADLLCFDEPLSSVDRATEEIITATFAELKAQGKILLVVTHDLHSLGATYDRLLLLNRKTVAWGTVSEVMTPENLQRAYGDRTHPERRERLPEFLGC